MSTKVGHFMIDSSQSSGKERVRFEFIVLLNKNGVVEIGPASILEDNNRSLKNNNPHSEKMVANGHMSNLVFSENLDVATTKDELRTAQEIEKMLEEQDKKVEQTKDQRNTLESFVYDTRSKLQNAYKRFVTELENDGITKRLQETEDWLYEDSDDECDEQIYTGKLEDLKKLLEPIEIRYKDEKKVQATKPLLAMIEENRLVADSLPLKNKMQLINACTKAEQYLSGHSPENYDPIGWSNFIKKTMGTFKRMCEEAIRPKLPIPKHAESVNIIKDENKLQATKHLLSMIKEYRLRADSLPDENKMKLIKECTEVEQYLSGLSPDIFDQISWSNHINDTMGEFNRRCQEAIQYELSSPEHPEIVESDRSCNHVDSQTENPVDKKQTGKSMDGNRTGNSMDGNRTGKPLEGNRTGKPLEGNQTGKPLERNRTGKPLERDQTSKPAKPDQTSKPAKPDQTNKPVKPDQTSKPVKPDQSSKPVDGNQTCKHVKPDQASKKKPVQMDQTSKPVNMGQTDGGCRSL